MVGAGPVATELDEVLCVNFLRRVLVRETRDAPLAVGCLVHLAAPSKTLAWDTPMEGISGGGDFSLSVSSRDGSSSVC